ncbi:hypothetical protein FBY03_1088 [Pseudomonas sp. SJZ079]|nr:hypothetical protein FBY03_1088 [Pseudomonas sp. SJZ079]
MPVSLDPRGAAAQTWPWGVRRASLRRTLRYQCAANRRLPGSPGTGYTLMELQNRMAHELEHATPGVDYRTEHLQRLMRWDNSRGVCRL